MTLFSALDTVNLKHKCVLMAGQNECVHGGAADCKLN